jgi:hypothetical protein
MEYVAFIDDIHDWAIIIGFIIAMVMIWYPTE